MTKTSPDNETLADVRQQIDAIDQQIQHLLNERARCAQKVAEIKGRLSDQAPVFYRPEREAQVLRGVMARNEGPLPDHEVARLFREIMSVCLALEQPLQVAFLGPGGSFTAQAVNKHFGHSVVMCAQDSLEDVFRETLSGNVDYGVVPIESADGGIPDHALDLLGRYGLKICGEVELQTHQHLLVPEERQLDDAQIETVLGSRAALERCRDWLDRHCPSARRQVIESGSEAVLQLQQDEASVLVGSESCADLYNLVSIRRNVETPAPNAMRYLVISRESVPASGQDKTSLIIMSHDNAGALSTLLEPFRRHGISLTRIESRAGDSQPWETQFYIDFEGHEQSPEISNLLTDLEQLPVEIKRLGSYPKAVL